MKNYIVKIVEEPSESDFELDFECQAEDSDHAREQAIDAYSRCRVIRIEEIKQ